MRKPQTKQCAECTFTKPLTHFYGDKTQKDGKMRRCKECQRNYDAQRAGTLRRKARLATKDANRNHEGTLSFYDVIWTLAETECMYCGEEVEEAKRTLEHVTPGNDFGSIGMCCTSCNSRKHNTPFIVFAVRHLTDYQTVRIVDRLALRRAQSFEETFNELYDDMKRYFTEKHERALEEARQAEKAGGDDA
ncbi:hypothetical protein [Salimicrobium flavidum]|uniref:HNH endonuclease n=1 Tax=Salimicrobium flavidum TaxID=570947 RepID=A0A1N7JXH2_9BACI|nr:hypothetical protein [Salimicrobium flavidum]SIS54045.1 hypothetical protein SAMN05421687_10827 [Salimicrobium flavidum]